MATVIMTLICLAIPSVITAQAVDSLPPAEVAVRSYAQGLTTEKVQAVRRIVDATFAPVGIMVSWVNCMVDRGASPSATDRDCIRPLGEREFILRVVSAGPLHGISDRAALGFSLIDRRVEAGSIATVYIDRVSALARSSRTDATELLARAIAHEIGHLLLGTDAHTPQGLMRAVWSRRELQHDKAADWQFSDVEGTMMRERLRRPERDSAPEAILATAR